MVSFIKKAEKLLQDVRGQRISRVQRAHKTVELAAFLVDAAIQEKTSEEKKREAWIARMVLDPKGRTFMTTMTDQCFRSHSMHRTNDQLLYLLKKYGIPHFLPESDRIKFLIFRLFGQHFPGFFIPIIRSKIYQEMSHVLLPQDPEEQIAYLKDCWKQNIQININHLGEAILGEQEAKRRLDAYLTDLENPLIEYVSVKISTIYSQINMIGFDHSLETLADRLRLLYRAAMRNQFKRVDGSEVKKFVNLDMEEYKDLHLTVAVFQKVLSEPEFFQTYAGIVLQSYLPDSFTIQQHLSQWAEDRKKHGGTPIKIRLVKGANLAMEAVESSIRGWQQAPFESKAETDANFKRMLEFGCAKQNADATHIGIGSHNLFDIAYALILRSEWETESYVQFEMLEGMAEPMRRVIKKLSGHMLLYCPEAKEQDFHTAVAYLIRRLDENCGSENFLRHFFEIRPSNKVWNQQAERFMSGFKLMDALPHICRRNQNRLVGNDSNDLSKPFFNEPDTDFSLEGNRKWAEQILREWENKKHSPIPLVIANEEHFTIQELGIDPSKPNASIYQYSLADVPLIEKAIGCAIENEIQWQNLPFAERSQLLGQAACVMRKKRDVLIGAMVADGGKTIWEADPEVSEAIDFIEYYRKNWEKQLCFSDLKWIAKGTVIVAPPWNFPCSIATSGIAAALTAGNCVLFKPAPEAVLVGWHVAQVFWEAGIPKNVLQFINCKEDTVGSYLIKHPKLASVVLTGATETAKKFLKLKPGIDLHAETGGKNAIIVTSMSDRDLAIRDIIQSAFSHSGQKCSACSLAILEAEIYDDPHFRQQLLDAAQSLLVASAWNRSAKITPLIRPPSDPLLRGLTQLEPKESWLLEPKPHSDNAHLWSPGIKWDVQAGSFTHTTELFGPVLGVMRAKNLEDAIRLANGTPYGLTSGLHSLDEREHHYWKTKIQAGNLYINRGITGAIVRRQPFGGCKASSFGSGAKAGGPNYVNQLARSIQVELPHESAPLPSSLIPLISSLEAFHLTQQEQQIWKKSAENYAYWAEILKEPTDSSLLLGQDNYFYHVPLDKAYVRIDNPAHYLPLLQAIAACQCCGTPLEISSASALPKLDFTPTISVTIEEEDSLIQRKPKRIRLFAPPSSSLCQKAAEASIMLQSAPVLANGRFELLHYLREVALSIDYHRYGYLGLRDPSLSAKDILERK